MSNIITPEELSGRFDVLLNSYSQKAVTGDSSSRVDINLDEYEKSVYLTKAQEEVVVNLYNGKNIYGDSFESTEEIRRYLDALIKTASSDEDKVKDEDNSEDDDIKKVDELLVNIKGLEPTSDLSNAEIFSLPNDIAFITLEKVTYSGEEGKCNLDGYSAKVYPITHDTYNTIKDNPFRGPTKYKALRLDYGENKVEIISKFPIKEYYIKYLKRPNPIILVDLTNENLQIDGKSEVQDLTLNPLLYETILQRAVALAAASRSKSS